MAWWLHTDRALAQNTEPRNSPRKRQLLFHQGHKAHQKAKYFPHPPPRPNGAGTIGYVFKEGKLNSYLENRRKFL